MSNMWKNIADAARDALLDYLGTSTAETQFRLESPIEAGLIEAFLLHARIHREHVAHVSDEFAAQKNFLLWEPQKQIENYRVDFCFSVRPYHPDYYAQPYGSEPKFSDPQFLVVECDGHNFHERTPEQALRDRARDRDLQMLGYAVFRFTGREIYRDAWGCAEQISSWADQVRWSLDPRNTRREDV